MKRKKDSFMLPFTFSTQIILQFSFSFIVFQYVIWVTFFLTFIEKLMHKILRVINSYNNNVKEVYIIFQLKNYEQ